MKKVLYFVLLLSLFSCVNTQKKQQKSEDQYTDILQVIYFHGNQRCMTCRAIESETANLIESEFSDKIKNGEMVFRIIDFSTPEGEEIADKYEVAWSSLFLNKNDEIVNLTDMGFKYAVNDQVRFRNELEKSINELLNK